jgi:hypothetical protein
MLGFMPLGDAILYDPGDVASLIVGLREQQEKPSWNATRTDEFPMNMMELPSPAALRAAGRHLVAELLLGEPSLVASGTGAWSLCTSAIDSCNAERQLLISGSGCGWLKQHQTAARAKITSQSRTPEEAYQSSL